MTSANAGSFLSFRSDYEGWKLVYCCNLVGNPTKLLVLEVTMRDGNQHATHDTQCLGWYKSFRSDYEGWKPLLFVIEKPISEI